MSKCFRGRLRSDPSIGVSDLMRPFEALFTSEASRDIKGLLEIGAEYDFKSSPQPKWLCKLHVLFSKLLDVAPNTVITSRKLRDALQRLHEESNIMPPGSKKDPDSILDWVDQKVRVGLAQLRELKDNSNSCKERAFKKCSDTEKDRLNSMLAKISLVRGQDFEVSPKEEKRSDDEGTPSTTTAQKESKKQLHEENEKMLQSTALVLVASNQQKKGPSYTPTKTNKRSVGDEGSSNRRMSPSSGSMNPSEIFESILEKRTKKKRRETTTSDSSEEGEETPDKINKRATKKRLSFSSTDDEEQAAAVLPGLPGFKILPAGKKLLKKKEKKNNRLDHDDHDDGKEAPKTPMKEKKTGKKKKKKTKRNTPSSSGGKKKKGDISFIDSVLDDRSKGDDEEAQEKKKKKKKRHEFSEDASSSVYLSICICMYILLFFYVLASKLFKGYLSCQLQLFSHCTMSL